jgi:hypothetical protein
MFLSLLDLVEQNLITQQLTPVLDLIYEVESLQFLEISPPMVEKLQSTQLQQVALVVMEKLVVQEQVAHGETAARAQVMPVVLKIQAQVSHQIFQALCWNMAAAEMEITALELVQPDQALEVEM